MKFKRLDLIARVDEAIQNRRQAAENAYAADLKKYQAAREEYLNSTRNGWLDFAGCIRAAVRADRPIRFDDVPESLRSGRYTRSINFWDRREPALQNVNVADLEAVRALLTAITDEEVAHSTLERFGINRRTLAEIFAAQLRKGSK